MTTRQSVYDSIGGIDKLDELVDHFYDLMALEPVFRDLRAMAPPRSFDLTRKAKVFSRRLDGRS